MASTDLFTSSPISGIELFNYPLSYLRFNIDPENRLPIGKQIEEELLSALEQDERYTVIAYGLQVQENGITLGELDFIVKDHKEEIIFHLELVHKFYIYDFLQGDEEIARWTGPNYRDKLTYKLDKLTVKQFPLLYQPATLPYLIALGLDPKTIRQKLCFKAELYQAPNHRVGELELLNTEAIQGSYYSYADFKITLDTHGLYHVCQKQQWIQDERSCTQYITDKECVALLDARAEDGRAVMVWTQLDGVFERKFVLFNS